VLNTGTRPAAPPIDGLEGTPYWTNRDAVTATDLPASLVVLGGGPIGCEFAQVFSRFGVDVTVVEVAGRLVAAEEPEASEALTQAFTDEGITVLAGATVDSVSHDDNGFTLRVDGTSVRAEKLLVAAGRHANLDFIGLDTVGLPDDLQVVETDERMRAGEQLWAIGDVTGKGAFTHVSMYQAAVVVRDALGEDGPWADYRAVPRVTFTSPEVASVGLSEKAARDGGLDVAVSTGDLGARGWLAKEQGVIKLVADRKRGVLVGGCVVAESGGEILSMLEAAVHAEIPVATLLTMHFAYPTYHRALEHALKELDLTTG
jgi:pyruvate/2-oxoglutarate dehydrogenase complex dihydrolipoamide dehydrogenase (E3) component